MGSRTRGLGVQQMQRYGGQQPRNMMPPAPRMGDGGKMFTPSYNVTPVQMAPGDVQDAGMSRAQAMQQRRNQLYSQRQNPMNLYQGQGAGHLSAVMGSNLGVGDPNKGYILHDMGDGQYAYNQGNLDPTLVNLTGDYSKWFK